MAWRIDEINRLITDLVSLMNQPQRADALLAEAGLAIDRALFAVLMGVYLYGPLRVGELADRGGRDYTTVSRQLAKLESMGLVQRTRSEIDARATEARLTPQGREAIDAFSAMRERIIEPVLARWSDADWHALIQLLRRFVHDLGTAKPSETPR